MKEQKAEISINSIMKSWLILKVSQDEGMSLVIEYQR